MENNNVPRTIIEGELPTSVPMRHGIMGHPGMSVYTKLVFNTLCSSLRDIGPGEEKEMNSPFLSGKLGMSESSAKRAIQDLKKHGYIDTRSVNTKFGRKRFVSLVDGWKEKTALYNWMYAVAYSGYTRNGKIKGLSYPLRLWFQNSQGVSADEAQQWREKEGVLWEGVKSSVSVEVYEVNEEGWLSTMCTKLGKILLAPNIPLALSDPGASTTQSDAHRPHRAMPIDQRDPDIDCNNIKNVIIDCNKEYAAESCGTRRDTDQTNTIPSLPENDGAPSSEKKEEFPSQEEERSFSGAGACVRGRLPEEYDPWVRGVMLRIRRKHPNRPFKDMEQRIKSGTKVVEQLVRLDGFPFEDIVRPVIEWAMTDNFWGKQVLSLAPLRNRAKNGSTKFENILTAFEDRGVSRSTITDTNFGLHADWCHRENLPGDPNEKYTSPMSGKELTQLMEGGK